MSGETYLKDIARDVREILLHVREAVHATKDAEAEVPERMRRFLMYFHDVHDLHKLYQGLGHNPPLHVKQEIERCDDRLRHLLDDLYTPGGIFEKIVRDMSTREGNRYDHTSLLPKG